MDGLLVPLILAASSLPAFLAAALIARGARRAGQPGAPALARLMLMVGIAILAGAAGLLWAGDNDTRRLAVIVAMVLAVNGLGVVLLVRLARSRRR
ncbi:hypothetical protein [Lysobacter niastensis]|uniref:Uncharacterized protein n=1 Tax=Lysobacter niastensis TaxID=380629 RepID=A0ABS0B4Y7_9GAMM|nr:hypothetical protein [Lysobacter niastensis]MBF6023678.1 hypothetical protein [Lysobacter niastensis]